jgi:hypothetical protein
LACQRETTGGRESGLLGVDLVANHGGHHCFTILRSNPAPSIHFTLTSSTNLRADRKPQLD